MTAVFDLIPVDQLAPGQTAEIGELMGTPEQVHRLEELGLRRGTLVEMVQPGKPCIVRTLGHKICFRANDVFSVLVRVPQTT